MIMSLSLRETHRAIASCPSGQSWNRPSAKRRKRAMASAGRALIGSVAERVLNSDKPVDVVDADNVLIGTISRERMSRALFSREGV